jgi:hypothetical protein
MKKYLFVIILILIPCYAFSAIPKVSDLYPAGKVFDPTNKIWTVPAKIISRGSSSIAVDSVALGLGKAVAGGLVTSLALAGIGYLGNQYLDWLMGLDETFRYDEDGVLVRDVQLGYPSGADGTAIERGMYWCSELMGWGSSHCVVDVTCYARELDCSGVQAQFGGQSPGWSSSFVVGGITYTFQVYRYMTPPYGATPENRMFHLGIVYTTTSQENQTIPVPVTVPQLHALVVEEIDKATDESAPIVDVVNKAIDKAADLVKNGEGIAAGEGTIANTIEDTLNLAIPESVATDLDEKLNDETAVDDAINDIVDDADEAENTKKSISDALTDFFGVDVAAPLDVTPGLPTKLSLTAIMQSFMNSINSMPIISTLRGITVNASGSSVLCVDLPANYGGSKCYDASSAQSTFNMIGTILLSMTTIFCFIQLFRG